MPLFVQWPQALPAGVVAHGLASSLDVAATLLDAANTVVAVPLGTLTLALALALALLAGNPNPNPNQVAVPLGSASAETAADGTRDGTRRGRASPPP